MNLTNPVQHAAHSAHLNWLRILDDNNDALIDLIGFSTPEQLCSDDFATYCHLIDEINDAGALRHAAFAAAGIFDAHVYQYHTAR